MREKKLEQGNEIVNENYWSEFYKTFEHKEPSSFAEFCKPFLSNKSIFDIGCGNGRDSYYFARNGFTVFGIDKYSLPEIKYGANFERKDFMAISEFKLPVYARFFLHAIQECEAFELINRTKDLILLEFRNKGDKAIIYTNHERNYIDGNELLRYMSNHGFDILFFQLSHGLAKFENEDPLICRLIAKRK